MKLEALIDALAACDAADLGVQQAKDALGAVATEFAQDWATTRKWRVEEAPPGWNATHVLTTPRSKTNAEELLFDATMRASSWTYNVWQNVGFGLFGGRSSYWAIYAKWQSSLEAVMFALPNRIPVDIRGITPEGVKQELADSRQRLQQLQEQVKTQETLLAMLTSVTPETPHE